MAADLTPVVNAFGWVQAYFRDVSQFCGRLVHEFEKHPSGYTALTGANIDWAASKVIDKYNQWMPLYVYQFFYREAGESEDGPEARSLLAVCLEHYRADADFKEPTLYLARFDTSKSDRKFAQIKGSIAYFWDITGSEEDAGDGWRRGVFQEMTFAFRTVPLGQVQALELVRKLVVDPLVAYDLAKPTEAAG